MPGVIGAAGNFLELLVIQLNFVGVQEVLGFEVAEPHELVCVLLVVGVEDREVLQQLIVLLVVHFDHAAHREAALQDGLAARRHDVDRFMEGLSQRAVQRLREGIGCALLLDDDGRVCFLLLALPLSDADLDFFFLPVGFVGITSTCSHSEIRLYVYDIPILISR